ncbi:hypothetical protein EH223_20420 [candidate division KSB1 bacterium]|nr:hypothetical protein [candidate division KSB1 bacterium]RQV99868.1 MAG: hypothetical protein EH223_20420 [candidate division KSB1 bacterium]
MKKNTGLVFVALALGLGWAIRGHFGHEHGAAWAGAIAGLAVIVVAKRQDWAQRLPVLAALAGIGWGVGGMMSYGLIVGYGRGVDFANVFYGLSMLGVVGALYGFIGGGFFGLGLESTEDQKPHWPSLLTEMIAGGLLAWYVIIAQFEWKMTPPRSELWAACLGAAVALAWYLYRNHYRRALRVAGYAALGAGFGFGFGNFLQTMGTISGASFNWWNVMEFSLGFFGGLGMAYAIYTREWPKGLAPSKAANWLAFVFLFLALPVVNIIQAMQVDKFLAAAERIGIENGAAFARLQISIAYLLTAIFFIFSVIFFRRWSENRQKINSEYSPTMFFLYTFFYLAFSHIIKLVFVKGQSFQLNQVLYWVVLISLFLMWLCNRKKVDFTFAVTKQESWRRWLVLIGVTILLIALCAFVSIISHAGIPGYHKRF